MQLSAKQQKELINTLKSRFVENMHRHQHIQWEKLQRKLEENPHKHWALHEMERTGGEPDVVNYDEMTGEYLFYDCSKESPIGRRSLCYDREAWESRKMNKPENNAVEMAAEMGIELMTEEDYNELQKLGDFHTKTSNWIKTSSDIRKLGGALFVDFRYGQVFIYHNGAQSYYAARGFRGFFKI